MRLLIYGNGYHTKKNLIPMVLEYRNFFSNVCIIDPYLDLEGGLVDSIKYYKGPSRLKFEKFDLVWIANSTNKHWSALNLLLEMFKSAQFIVEKPIFDRLEQFSILTQGRTNLFEASMYEHHRCWNFIAATLSTKEFKKVRSSFLIPKTSAFIDGGDWDVEKVIRDVGYYPIHSTFKYLGFTSTDIFGSPKIKITNDLCQFESQFNWQGADIKCEFGVSDRYMNQLEIAFTDKRYVFNFVFSKPQNACILEIHKSWLSSPKVLQLQDKNHFFALLNYVICGPENTENLTLAKNTFFAMDKFIELSRR